MKQAATLWFGVGVRIAFSIVGPQGILPQVKEGKLRALAVTSAERYAPLPDVPTLVESGFPALAIPVWFAAYVPAATPAPVLATLREKLAQTLASPEYRAGLEKQGAQSMPLPVDASAARFETERKLWVDAVERTGAKD